MLTRAVKTCERTCLELRTVRTMNFSQETTAWGALGVDGGQPNQPSLRLCEIGYTTSSGMIDPSPEKTQKTLAYWAGL